MTTLAAPAAADQAVFRFTVPLSPQELLTLTGLGETWRTRRDTRGWALLDARGRVWGWHPFDTDDLDWCDAPSALAAFIVKPHVRARLVHDGFHVVDDEDGALFHALLSAGPWSGLPPLPSGPSARPEEPILPHWGNLLDAALAAVSACGGVLEVGVAVDELIALREPGFRRPSIFDPVAMRRWLASDDAPAALTAMRVAAGWVTGPGTVADAIGLLDPLGCTARPGARHTVDAHLSDGDWSIGSCRVCWHPVLMYESPHSAALPTVWAMFGDLR